MSKKEEGSFDEFVSTHNHLGHWLQYEAMTIWDQKLVETWKAVYRTLAAIYPKENFRPKIAEKRMVFKGSRESIRSYMKQNQILNWLKYFKGREVQSWEFIIELLPGQGFRDLKDKINLFEDSTGGAVEIKKCGKAVSILVSVEPLQSHYDFKFEGEKYKNKFLPILLGYSANGEEVVDLAKLPYLLIGGVPRGGKSNLIHVIITCILSSRAKESFITVIDFKRSEYKGYMRRYGLLVTNDIEAFNVLQALNNELDKRMDDLPDHIVNIYELPKKKRPPLMILVIDELTELQDKESQLSLNRLMRLGGAYGFIIILATQKPSRNTFSSGNFTETRSLCDGRICFRVKSQDDSKMILNNARGVDLPSTRGRAIFQWDKEIEIQVPYLQPKRIPQILGELEVNRVVSNLQSPTLLLPKQRNNGKFR